MVEETSPETGQTERVSEEPDSVILRELRKLRQEHAEASGNNKKHRNTEDRMTWVERVAAFLFQETTKLAVKCDDLESRMRRNNICIHGFPDGVEKNDSIG